jgi:alkylation response protein AidB-like acyl-CoA dehydrogenase
MQPAEKVDGGYRISARWPYNSGSHHASRFGGGAIVVKGGAPIMTPFGTPQIRMLNFSRADAEILDTWKVTGLRGTGSADVVVKDLFVPDSRAITIGPGMAPNAMCQAPIFKVPFMAFIGMPIGAIALGIAQHAVDAFMQMAGSKARAGTEQTLAQRATTHASLGESIAALKAARCWFYDVAQRTWDLTVEGRPVPMDVRIDGQLAGAHATRTAASVVDAIQLMAGGTAIYEASPLERCFRDIHTVTQHAGTSHRNFENAGALLLSQPLANPIILL